MLAPLHSEADFIQYKGKLKGKIVLIFDPRELSLRTEPEAHRLSDEEVQARTENTRSFAYRLWRRWPARNPSASPR